MHCNERVAPADATTEKAHEATKTQHSHKYIHNFFKKRDVLLNFHVLGGCQDTLCYLVTQVICVTEF